VGFKTDMNDKFIRTDTTTENSGKIKMTITHVLSGKFVSGEGIKKFALRDELLEKLDKILYEEKDLKI
jgi:hypothetical protein